MDGWTDRLKQQGEGKKIGRWIDRQTDRHTDKTWMLECVWDLDEIRYSSL